MDPSELVQRGLLALAETGLPAELKIFLEALESALKLPSFLVYHADEIEPARTDSPVAG